MVPAVIETVQWKPKFGLGMQTRARLWSFQAGAHRARAFHWILRLVDYQRSFGEALRNVYGIRGTGTMTKLWSLRDKSRTDDLPDRLGSSLGPALGKSGVGKVAGRCGLPFARTASNFGNNAV